MLLNDKSRVNRLVKDPKQLVYIYPNSNLLLETFRIIRVSDTLSRFSIYSRS